MNDFVRRSDFYPPNAATWDLVDMAEIEPPQRDSGIPSFKKYKLVPVLFAFSSPECALPLVKLNWIEGSDRYLYKVHNGFHRFYASFAVGYTKLPAFIEQPFIP